MATIMFYLIDRKQEQQEGSSYRGVHYDYDGNQEDQVLEPTFHLHFDVPEGMAVVSFGGGRKSGSTETEIESATN